MGREDLQKAESPSWSPRASFYRKGVATVAHRRWKGYNNARLSLALHQGTFYAPCLGVLALSGTGERSVSSIAAPSRVDTRPGQRCPRCHVGRQAAEVAQWWVSMKICMPPRRCLPSWLGRQLHAHSGGGLVGVGLMVALWVSSARALLGPRQGSCRGARCHPRQGACRGPCGLPRLGSRQGLSSP